MEPTIGMWRPWGRWLLFAGLAPFLLNAALLPLYFIPSDWLPIALFSATLALSATPLLRLPIRGRRRSLLVLIYLLGITGPAFVFTSLLCLYVSPT